MFYYRIMTAVIGLLLWAEGGIAMDGGLVTIDDVEVSVGTAERDGETFVELNPFCEATGAVVKPIPGSGQLSVCRDDLCILLTDTDLIRVEGADFVNLDQVAPPLQLYWRAIGRNIVIRTGTEPSGLGLGDRPPTFELADLFTGATVRSTDFTGKPTAFYMWASW